ncbi:MAG TPA: PfkB family carbohydrate kinase [Opitutaceae bacterium]|nr:PfkB family carbohydrate kinase [Opitutaceae bacterium]
MHYDVAIFGNYTKDTIISAAGTRVVDGGGFNYGAHVMAMMGLRTAALTRLAREDERVITALRRIGVDAFPTYTPHSTHLQLVYPSANPDDRQLTMTQVTGAFTPDQFRNVEAKYYLVNASARGEVGRDVILELKRKGGRIVVDAQGFVRRAAADGTLVFDDWPGRDEILPYVDILKVDNKEAAALTGLDDLQLAARTIAAWGPREIVLSHRDGLIVFAEGRIHEAPWRHEKLVGRSGRGDTCISSYAAKRLSSSAAEATIWSAAVTSLKMEAEGPIKVPAAAVVDFIAKKYAPPAE